MNGKETRETMATTIMTHDIKAKKGKCFQHYFTLREKNRWRMTQAKHVFKLFVRMFLCQSKLTI